MEQNFQTSFIPKRPIVEPTKTQSRSIGIFTVLSLLFFFAVGAGYGGLYFYKGIVAKSIVAKQADLKKAEGRFEVKTIKELKNLDRKLVASKEVLAGHIVVSPVFAELQKITMKTVSFTDFSYDLSEIQNKKVEIKLKGVAVGYRSVALQSDLFAKNKNFIDPLFSGLVLDDKGTVSFDVTFFVDPSFVDYKQSLKTEGQPVVNATSTEQSLPVETQNNIEGVVN